MKNVNTITVNFKGGIIPHEDLYNILVAAGKSGLLDVRFGLRQQLLLDVNFDEVDRLTSELSMLGIIYEINSYNYPNMVSSFPAEGVFILNTWLSEIIYKEILNSITHRHKLKVNLSANQSFTPLLTGNINWVASPEEENYWHLFIRFPKTNIIYEWKDMVQTRDIAAMSQRIEETILFDARKFYDHANASGDELYDLISKEPFVTKSAGGSLELPPFNLPYYEGLNRSQEKYWLGIYRRDELFNIQFLKEVCMLCHQTEIVQLCSTPWKTIIIKGILEKNRNDWNLILDKHQINVRHAANELNFQVEDNSFEALKLKMHLVKYLNNDDTRTFGVCIGIKTRRKSEVFSSILVRKRYVFRIGKLGFITMYDILCAKNYNPNERTDFVYSRNNPRFVLAEQLRRAILSYYDHLVRKDETTRAIIETDADTVFAEE